MPPIPCAHCGGNFMRPTIDPEAPKLCNNCLVREEKRNPQTKATMSNVNILLTCPKDVQIEIEELCINKGIDFTRYFLELHYASQNAIEIMKENAKEHREKGGKWEDDEKVETLPATSTTGLPPKFAVKKKGGK